MAGVALLLGAIVVAAVVAATLAWIVFANRRAGVSGFVRRVLLTCPKCGGRFEYALVPGASVSTVRLGGRRYMACPLCGRWSSITVAGAPLAPPSGPSRQGPPQDP